MIDTKTMRRRVNQLLNAYLAVPSPVVLEAYKILHRQLMELEAEQSR